MDPAVHRAIAARRQRVPVAARKIDPSAARAGDLAPLDGVFISVHDDAVVRHVLHEKMPQDVPAPREFQAVRTGCRQREALDRHMIRHAPDERFAGE